MADADQLRDANPWHPITDQVDLQHLGKLGEETSELGSAVSRCIIQGVNECEPTTGKMNRVWLEDEIGDVLANIDLVVDRFGLDLNRILQRSSRKKLHLRQWHAMAGSEQPGLLTVPVEPTTAMLAAGQTAWRNDPLKRSTTLYRAMVEAAPVARCQRPEGGR